MSTKKVALITGATSGIGKELARCFALNGYSIIIVGRDEQKLIRTTGEFKKEYSADISTITIDLSELGAAQKLMAALGDRQVDVVVNNAGYTVYGPFIESDVDAMSKLIRINVENLTELTRLVLPQMITRRSGRILNVASTAAFQPGPLMAVYHASKAYVLSFSEAIRYELVGTGVTISTVCPGPTDTNFHKRAGISSSKLFRSGAMTPRDVAEAAYLGLMDDQAVIIPGFKNKLRQILAMIAPRTFALKSINNLNKTE